MKKFMPNSEKHGIIEVMINAFSQLSLLAAGKKLFQLELKFD
jgi:hypothetical protein